MNKQDFREALLRMVQGAIIGAGAILPGVSGGVLCAAFGLYMPLMELIANPLKDIKKSVKLWFPVCFGCAVGFLLFAGVLLAMFEASMSVAMSVFIGFILGTLPALFREAKNKAAKSKAAKYICLATTFILFLLMFSLLSRGGGVSLGKGVGPFLLCGAVLGLSFIIPGLTSSSTLMYLGLYTPMMEGATSLDFSVIIPVGIGALLAVVSLAKLMKKLFSSFYTEAYYAVIGIVLSSTIAIIPKSFASFTEAVLCILAVIAGGAISLFVDKKFSR